MDKTEAIEKMGEMIKERYQIVNDLGYGGDNETTEAWLSFIFTDIEDEEDYNYVVGKKVTLCLVADENEKHISIDVMIDKNDNDSYTVTQNIKPEDVESRFYDRILDAMHQIDLMIDGNL